MSVSDLTTHVGGLEKGACSEEADVCILVGRLTAEQGSERDALEQLELSTIDPGSDRVTGVESAQSETLAFWVEDCVLRAGGIRIVPHLERTVDGGGAGRDREGQDAGEGGDLHLERFVRLAGWMLSVDSSRSSWLADREPEEHRMECSLSPLYHFLRSPSPRPTAKLSSILWDWTGLQQGSHLAALAVPSPQSLNDRTAGPPCSYLRPLK